jgi:hypothetical protein
MHSWSGLEAGRPDPLLFGTSPLSLQLLREVQMVNEEERTGTWHAYSSKMPGKSKSKFNANSASNLRGIAFSNPFPATGNSKFTDYLTRHFPAVAASIDTDCWLLHLEVGAMTLASREAILKGDWPTLCSHFSFIDSVLESADKELHDAIGVSYLVNLFYDETSLHYAKARTLMPKRLAAALEIMERHYEEL